MLSLCKLRGRQLRVLKSHAQYRAIGRVAESGLRHSTRNRAWGKPPWVRIPPLPPPILSHDSKCKRDPSKLDVRGSFEVITAERQTIEHGKVLVNALAGLFFLGGTWH